MSVSEYNAELEQRMVEAAVCEAADAQIAAQGWVGITITDAALSEFLGLACFTTTDLPVLLAHWARQLPEADRALLLACQGSGHLVVAESHPFADWRAEIPYTKGLSPSQMHTLNAHAEALTSEVRTLIEGVEATLAPDLAQFRQAVHAEHVQGLRQRLHEAPGGAAQLFG